MTPKAIDRFLEIRSKFYERNKANKRIWYTSLVSGNFRNTILYRELSGVSGTVKTRPFWGFLRYCLMELPFRAAHRIPDANLLIATVFIRQSNKTITEAFFGSLPSTLRQEGFGVICAGRIAHSFSRSVEKEARHCLGDQIVCPTHILTKYDGLLCLAKAAASFFLCRYPKECRGSLRKDMLQSHISEVLTALLYEAMIGKIAARNPQIHILHPFEGNVWEAACTLSGQPCTGYQHSSVLNDQYKMSYFPGRPVPAKIITTGPEAAKNLSRLWGYPQDMLVNGCSLRQEKIYSVAPKTNPPAAAKRILMLMQGDEHKNGILDFLREFKKSNPDVEVSLRPHPAVPLAKMGIDKDQEFLISTEPDIYNDILHHDACLYVSSTASLEAIYLGTPVVHLSADDDVDGDPLHGISYLKRNAATAEELAGHLREFAGYPCFQEEFALARDYFERYFGKPDNSIEKQFKEWLAPSSAS